MELDIILDTTEGKKNIKYSYTDKILLITTETDKKIIIDSFETKRYYLNGILHRLDGPAVEHSDGSKYYYLNGILHRADGPAIESANGSKHYYLDGKRHRVDGPAAEFPNGSKHYYLDDKRHRVDGPAEIEMENGKVVKIAKWINGILINELTF